MKRLARLRIPLGFLSAAIAFVLARPSWPSWSIGLTIAVCGELLRLWAAGHIEKGREITRSGPYRLTRHPLYLGSSVLGAGFAIASHSIGVAILVLVYLAVTLTAAVRTEEAGLDAKFDGAYSDYRSGRSAPASASRRFSWDRVSANREHRADRLVGGRPDLKGPDSRSFEWSPGPFRPGDGDKRHTKPGFVLRKQETRFPREFGTSASSPHNARAPSFDIGAARLVQVMSADARVRELSLALPPAPKPLAGDKPLVLATWPTCRATGPSSSTAP
jgi:hypothetical protein